MPPSKAIFQLMSTNIFRNLAFEHCLYEQLQLRLGGSKKLFENYGNEKTRHLTHALLLWRDSPCIVIGRHQCVWQEVKMTHLRHMTTILREKKEIDDDIDCIPVVRRPSGGGAVYHDLGNWCISLLMPRNEFSRSTHTQWLANCVRKCKRHDQVQVTAGNSRDYSVETSFLNEELVMASSRGDIMYDNYYKFSGSASKLASAAAYHHCTVLSRSNLNFIENVLQPSFAQLTTRATSSVRSPVTNIHLVDSRWIETLQDEFSQMHTSDLVPIIMIAEGDEGNYVHPEVFEETVKNFSSWEWIYARSPAFTIKLPLFSENQNNRDFNWMLVSCENGCIADISIVGDNSEQTNTMTLPNQSRDFLDFVNKTLRSCPLTEDVKDRISAMLRSTTTFGEFETALYRCLLDFSNQL